MSAVLEVAREGCGVCCVNEVGVVHIIIIKMDGC